MDTVLDGHYQAIFSGTPQEVQDYLKENPPDDKTFVRVGESGTVMYAADYLANTPA